MKLDLGRPIPRFWCRYSPLCYIKIRAPGKNPYKYAILHRYRAFAPVAAVCPSTFSNRLDIALWYH